MKHNMKYSSFKESMSATKHWKKNYQRKIILRIPKNPNIPPPKKKIWQTFLSIQISENEIFCFFSVSHKNQNKVELEKYVSIFVHKTAPDPHQISPSSRKHWIIKI